MNNPLIDSMSHDEMDKQFGIECARFGWKAYHEKDSRGSRKGWPDWVASNGASHDIRRVQDSQRPAQKRSIRVASQICLLPDTALM